MPISRYKKWAKMLSGNSVFHVNQDEGKVYPKNDLAGYYNNLIEKITRFGLSDDSVPKDDVKKELSSVNYGFIIREDSIVNRVATPTKISSYMSAGVIPIFSTCLKDFSVLAQNLKYAKAVENLDEKGVADVICYIKKPIEKEDVKEEYKKLFDSYYGKHTHCANLEILFKKVL